MASMAARNIQQTGLAVLCPRQPWDPPRNLRTLQHEHRAPRTRFAKLTMDADGGTQYYDRIMREYATTILQCCLDSAGFGATDDRDRVYALLGIAKAMTGYASAAVSRDGLAERLPSLAIDYTRDTMLIYADLIKFLINLTGTLESLLLLRSSPAPSHTSRPSWIVDWRHDVNTPNIILRAMAGDLPQGRAYRQSLVDRDRELRLSGTVIAHIQQATPETNSDKVIGIRPDGYNSVLADRVLTSEGSQLIDVYPSPYAFWNIAPHMPNDAQSFNNMGVFAAQFAQPDDLIVKFAGSAFLFVIRPEDSQAERHVIVSPCCWWARVYQASYQAPTSRQYHLFDAAADLHYFWYDEARTVHEPPIDPKHQPPSGWTLFLERIIEQDRWGETKDHVFTTEDFWMA